MTGALGVIWSFFWFIIVKSSPDQDKYIIEDELQYIRESIGKTENINVKHPWKEFFRSKAVYANCASHFAEAWGFYTLLTQLPTFLKGRSIPNFSIRM